MQDSGVEWLGEVSEHWEIVHAGHVFIESGERGDASLPVLMVSIHSGVSDTEHEPD